MNSKDRYIIAFDQGTTSSRTVLVSSKCHVIDVERIKTTTYHPNLDWAEQDAIKILEAQLQTLTTIVERNKLSQNKVCALAIANQRETVIVWYKDTGKPAYNAITWQDKRTNEYCDYLKSCNVGQTIKEKTGLIIDPYFSATKIKWILDNVPELKKHAEKGNLLFGTIDSWLLYNISQEKNHFTDVTNASRTMLFNIHSLEWDKDLLKLFNIPRQMLPEVKSNDFIYGHLNQTAVKGAPIAAIIGDQQASLFGQLCFNPGDSKITYGTGAFLVSNTGNQSRCIENMLTTIAWKRQAKVTYALEGSIFTAGSAIQWLKNDLLHLDSTKELEQLALTVDDSLGVCFVPALSGLGSPYWDQEARGLIIGITSSTKAAHIARAALEAIAFQVSDMIAYLKASVKLTRSMSIRVDGGMAQNKFLLQFQADLLQEVLEKGITESTALGAAYIAGLTVQLWDDLKNISKPDIVTINPKMTKEEANFKRQLWAKAVQRSFQWHVS